MVGGSDLKLLSLLQQSWCLTDNMRGVSPLSPPFILISAPPSSNSATTIAVCPASDATCKGA